jgi:glycosyltransferase involved in cell wall biosynthesis
VDRCRALIFIPALDEAETIASVVTECLAICDVLVLDDGSSDATSIEAKNAGASVISNKSPGGYDKAIRTGFEYAVDHEFDILITADADGQHSASDIKRALDTIRSNQETALVVGTRDKLNRISEHLFSYVSRLVFGVADPLSGLKAYRIKDLKGLSEYVGTNIGTLIVVACVKLNKKIQMIGITIEPRTAGHSRFGHSLSGELKILRALLTFMFARPGNIRTEMEPEISTNKKEQADH